MYGRSTGPTLSVPPTGVLLSAPVLGMPLVLNCDSEVTASFAGTLSLPSVAETGTQVVLQLVVENLCTGVSVGVPVPPTAALQPGGVVPITAVLTHLLVRGQYVIQVVVRSVPSAAQLHIDGVLNVITTSTCDCLGE